MGGNVILLPDIADLSSSSGRLARSWSEPVWMGTATDGRQATGHTIFKLNFFHQGSFSSMSLTYIGTCASCCLDDTRESSVDHISG